MATGATRKARGAATQTAVAEYFKANGWPWAESTGAGRAGVDVTGMPGLACEVKARRDFNPLAWVKQARRNASAALPFVVHRPDGMGTASVGQWLVTMALEDFAGLLRDAGYGDKEGAAPGGGPF